MKYLVGLFLILISSVASAQTMKSPHTVNLPVQCAPATQELMDEMNMAFEILIESDKMVKQPNGTDQKITQHILISKNKKLLAVTQYVEFANQFCVISVTQNPKLMMEDDEHT